MTSNVIKRPVAVHSLLLTIIFLVLTVIGMANLYSAAAEQQSFFTVQLRHLPIGLGLYFVLGWFISIRHVNTYAYLSYVLVILSLVIVFLTGHIAGGAQRWIRLGGFGFQPSEFAKLAVALTIAKFFYNNRNIAIYTLKDMAPLLFAVGAVFILIFEQPDFGTAGVCVLIAMAQLVFVRVRITMRNIIVVGVASLVGGVIGWNFFLRPYQKLRVLNLFDPTLDPSGSGYNSLQSLVAIGSGNQFGKGFLQGTQTQLQFLPARHTDFIFSVFAEEHGFWVGAFVFILFSCIAYIALEIAREARDSFNALLAIGAAAVIFIEFTINVAMVLGIFPVVGMPLPFFSYGGSSLLTICVAMGLLVSIDRDNVRGSSGHVWT